MKTRSQKRQTAVLLWPANAESHRQRIVGFFREAAINDRLAAFLVDSSRASWQRELKTLIRDLEVDVIAAHPDCVPSLRRLIRQTKARAQIHILDVGTKLRDFRFYVDNRAIGNAAAEFFLARGLRHFGYIGFKREPQYSEPRRAAFREAIIRGKVQYYGDFSWSSTNRATKKLLATTRLPIGEVASKAGFSSAANFHRNFTRAFGRSPSAYRAR